MSIDDPATGQVVGGDLDSYDIAGHDADEILTHTARNVGEDFVLGSARVRLDNELRVGQGLQNPCVELNVFRTSQKSPVL